MSSNIKIIRVCKHCNKEFTARTTKTKYCSLDCNRKDYKKRIKEKKIQASNKETSLKINKPLLSPLQKVQFFANTLECRKNYFSDYSEFIFPMQF